MVEVFFGTLPVVAELHLGEHLIAASETFIDCWNTRCDLFVWTKTVDQIVTEASGG